MNGRNAVGAVRADDRQIRHPHLLRRSLFNQADTARAILLPRESLAHGRQQPAVDFVNDLQVPRQHDFEPLDRPFFQGFGEQRVVRVSQRPLRDVPRLIPAKLHVVEQDSHQLGNGYARMRVVKLNGDFVGKRVPILVRFAESPDCVSNRAGSQEILLKESQALAFRRLIVGIQNARDRFSARDFPPVRRRNRRR